VTLISCPECKNEISSEANSCPRCGYSLAKGKDKKSSSSCSTSCLGIVLISVILVIIGPLCYLGFDSPRSSYSSSSRLTRTVTPRSAVSQISIERTKLLQKLEILKQKRKAKWAEIESAEPTGDGRGVLRLVRLGQEHSDIMDEIQELKRQINKM